ncbi:DcrB/PsbP domain-containing protein [Pseudomonas synxantha]|uniref:DcrB-related protein n=1 Tax=Pseudomonas synxantha TaxID=47883 RepID=UPI0006149439|nr:DcrB-related protein [Pseudomonas synxantha]
MMRQRNLYDRLSERRLAEHNVPTVEADEPPAPEIAASAQDITSELQPEHCSLILAGLQLTFPEHLAPTRAEITLYKQGHPVSINLQRLPVPDNHTLERAMDTECAELQHHCKQLHILRRSERTLAGARALVLDYRFTRENEEKHGRSVGVLLPINGHTHRQWFCISCVFGCRHEALSDWLPEFDALLDTLASA